MDPNLSRVEGIILHHSSLRDSGGGAAQQHPANYAASFGAGTNPLWNYFIPNTLPIYKTYLKKKHSRKKDKQESGPFTPLSGDYISEVAPLLVIPYIYVLCRLRSMLQLIDI